MSGYPEVHGIIGHIGHSKPARDYLLASMADWFTIKNLDISGEAGNVVISTKYPGLVCKQIGNVGTSDATVIVKYDNGLGAAGDDDTFKLAANYGASGKLPPIHTIVKSGTSDDLRLYMQKAENVSES